MPEVCPVCGQPKELCVCGEMAKESQRVQIRVVHRRFGKTVTTISGFNSDINISELGKEFKKTLACGGTAKNGVIELQGNHKQKAKEILLREGFSENQIEA